MIISHSKKFVFIKTRKTAGSTLERVLRPLLGEDDICTGSTRDGTPPLNCKPDTNGHRVPSPTEYPDDYFVFSIERNPFDKVVSSYYWHQHIKPHIFGEMDFETYIKSCNLLPEDWSFYRNADRVFKYEEMEEMYLYLRYHFRLDIRMNKVYDTKLKSNTRKVKDYRDMHTDTTKAIVSEIFKNEIEEFGYEF